MGLNKAKGGNGIKMKVGITPSYAENGFTFKEDNFECLYHYLNNTFKDKPANFKEWIYYTFL